MEYLMNKLRNKNCEIFISKNKQLIENVFTNTVPDIHPVKNINFFEDNLTKWRYYCYSNQNTHLLVSLDKKLNGNHIFKYKIKVSDKQLDYIKLQLNFIKMGFNDFINYLFDNIEKFKSANLGQFKNGIKNHWLEIGIGDGNGNFFKSESFYELIESSKIFFTNNNWDIFEKQLSFAFGNEFDKTIRNFFKLKFLKFYLYQNYSLIDQEYILLSGSFLLFAMGFRSSRDIDIYSLEENGNILNKRDFSCEFNVNNIRLKDRDYNDWKKIIMNPKRYCFLFGFKTNILEIELLKRLGRITALDSHKALADFLVLKYFMGMKTKLSIEKDLEKLLYHRYKDFDRIAIKRFFGQK